MKPAPEPTVPFRWAAPTERLPAITTVTAADLQADAEIIEWLLAQRATVAPDGRRPAERMAAQLRRWASFANDEGQRLDGLHDPLRRMIGGHTLANVGALSDLFGGRLLAWCTRVLESHALAKPKAYLASGDFFRHELAGTDAPGSGDLPWLPGGLGTYYLAAHLVHRVGGAIRIGGKATPGADVGWVPAEGTKILFERKDHAFHEAFAPDSTPASASEWALKRLAKATTGLERRVGMKREIETPMCVASIGGMFPAPVAEHLHASARPLAERFVKRLAKNKRRPPHAVLVYVIGYDISVESVAPSSLTHVVEFVPIGSRHAHAGSQWLRDAFDRSSHGDAATRTK